MVAYNFTGAEIGLKYFKRRIIAKFFVVTQDGDIFSDGSNNEINDKLNNCFSIPYSGKPKPQFISDLPRGSLFKIKNYLSKSPQKFVYMKGVVNLENPRSLFDNFSFKCTPIYKLNLDLRSTLVFHNCENAPENIMRSFFEEERKLISDEISKRNSK